MSQFLKFCAVGTLGFAVDSSTTLLLVRLELLPPVAARTFAFCLGAGATWALNRKFTFRSDAGWRRLVLYLILTSLGALLNVGAFTLWVRQFGSGSTQLLLGIAFGASLALALNFGISKYLVFQSPRSQ